MTIALTILSTGTLVGLATSQYFRVGVLMLVSPLIAVVSAIALQVDGVELAASAPLVTGCLALSQLAYLAGAFLSPEIDGPIAE